MNTLQSAYIPRAAESSLLSLASGYPVVVVVGPRQSGKTTLTRRLFPDKPYVSLEDLDEREFATSDPRGFLSRFPDGAVFDEVQRCPDLLSYLQGRVDADGRMGLFILTGSQQFGLMAGVTQSLAGRAAMLCLLPFSNAELLSAERLPDLNTLLFQGAYPPIYSRQVDPSVWLGNYVRTYLERDVRLLLNIRDLSNFSRFLHLCAGRVGQLLNLSDLAGECGITHNTAKAWLSVLEACFIVHLLQPYYRNFSKRHVKTPKLYFHDTGLACWLLGIKTPAQIALHPMRGALFESLMVTEWIKSRRNQSQEPNLYFWRDRSGHEIDLIIDQGDQLLPVEIKSGLTVAADAFGPLEKWGGIAGSLAGQPSLVYGGIDAYIRRGCRVLPWSAWGR